jgi:hypothetical protein
MRGEIVPDIVVMNTNDAGAGSLRQAIAAASPGATIGFDPSIAGKTITLSGALIVDHDLVIEGPDASGVTLDGNGQAGIVKIDGGTLTLRRLTLSRAGNGGDAIFADGGNVVMDHSTVIGSEFGLVSKHSATLTNSTFSGNGVAVQLNVGDLTITHSTIADNSEVGLRVLGGTLHITNSIIADNTENCVTAGGFQATFDGIVSNSTCFQRPGTLAIDLLPLADIGGPTKSHALARTSAAIDLFDCPPTIADDQRGIARPQFARCDAGAVEFENFLTVPITVASSATLNADAGAVLINGTIPCPAEQLALHLSVTLTQPQRVKGISFDAKSSADVTVNCPGTNQWSVFVLPPQNGSFVTGNATVTAKLTDLLPFTESAAVEAAVKIVKAKK